jgi:hypothetical protein
MLKGRKCGAVVAALHVSLAKAHEPIGVSVIEFGNLLKLGNGYVKLSFFVGCDSSLHVLSGLG